MDDLNIQAGVTVNAEQAERAFTNLGDKAQKMANEVTKAADKAGEATDGMGDGAEKSAEKFTRAESRMRAAIQKSTRELEMLGKTASQKFEAQLDFKGLDKAKFQPVLDDLRKMEEATKKAESGLSGLGSAAQAAGRAMAVAFSGAAAFGVVGKLVEVQREFDVLNSSLKTVTGSSAAAEREMAWLKDFAKETPFGLAQATQGFVKMKALGLDPTRAALTSFGNTASAMGKDLNQMIEAVADASTGEFERLKEFGIKAKKEGGNVSLTFQGVTTTIKNSAAEITQYLENIGNVSFGGAMEERAKTLDGTIAALGDTWDELFRAVSTNNVGGLIFDSVTLANGVLEDATTIIRAMGGAVGETSREFGSLSAIQGGVAAFFETVSVLAANTLYVLRQTGDTMAGVAAGYKAFFSFDFDAVRAIGAEMKANGEAARKEIDATTARILNARKAQEEYARYATRNASAATDPRRVDLGGSAPRATGGVSSGTAKAVKETISEYDKLIKKLSDELPKAAAEAEAAQMGYNKSQTEFLALAGSDVWAKFSNSERARVASLYEGKIASEQAGDAAKELSKAYAEAAAERIKTIQSMERAADSLQSQNDALREEIELIGLSTEQQTLVLQQRNDVIILTKEATLAELERQSAITGTQTRVEIALASEIEALKERNALLGAKGVKNAAVDAAKTAKDEWQKTTDSINQSLTDSLLRGFESGKDFAKNLRDTIVNLFKTMVLRPVISAVVNPIAGAVTGALGLSGAANASTGGASMVGNVGSLLGAGSSAFGIGASYGATSLFANGLGATLSAGGQMIGAGSVMSGIGTIAGALGPIALGIGAIASIVSKLDDSGTYHTGGAAQYSSATGLLSGQSGADYNIGFGRVEAGADSIKAVGGIAQALGTALDGVAVSFGQKAGYEIATAFADDTSKDGAWGALRISKDGADLLNWENTRQSRWAPREFGDGEGGYKEYLAEIAKDTRTVLLDMDLPSWADTMLESIGDAANMEQLSATLQQIGVIQTTFVQLGKTMEGFAGLTDKAFEALMKASGGFESLAANAGSYYENFYSDAEKTAAVTRSVSDALTAVGLQMPATRDEFRALVESQLALGEEGAKASAALLGVSGAFASVVPAAEAVEQEIRAAEDAVRAIGKAFSDAMSDIASTRFDLENQLLAQSGQGSLVQQRIDQRDFAELTKGLPEEQAAKVREQFEANLKLRDQYEANQLAADNLAKAMEEMERQQNAAAQAQRSMLQSTVHSAQNAVSQLKSIFDMLDGSIASLRGSVASAAEQDSRAAREYIAKASVLMRSGSVVDAGRLQAAVRAATAGIDSQQFGSSYEADFERLKLAGELAGLQDSTAGQLTVAEQHLSIAESQLAALEYIASSISSLAGAQQAAAGQPRDQWSTVSGKQVYASSGGAVGVNTGSGIDIYGKDGSLFTGAEAIAFVRNQVAVNDEASVYAAAVRAGISSKALDELMGWDAGTSNAWAEMNKLPKFAVGTNYVPRDMLAQIHEGEAIVPKAFNPWANGSTGGDNTALIAELRALRAEVAELRNAAEVTAGATGATADVLVRVTNNGNGMVTAAAPI